MRLSEKEVGEIKRLFHLHFPGKAELYLFGSRTDDSARGGDIDLLILTSDLDYSQAISKKIDFLVALKQSIGEQKIDLFILSESKKTSDPFYQLIEGSLLKLV